MINKALLILILINMYGCSSNSIYRELFESMSALISSPDDISKESIEKIKFSTKQARIGRTSNTIIVLEEINEDILKWTSSNDVKIYTLNDYIIRLTGLGNELENLALDDKHPGLTKKFQPVLNEELISFYTFRYPDLHRLPIKTKFSNLGSREIEIFGKKIETNLYIEKSQKNLISWNFENFFWVDEYGDIVKSIQNFSPKHPEIHLLSTKKYKKPE